MVRMMAGAPRIVCPICGAPLPGAVDSCPTCGAALPERALKVYLRALGVDLDAMSRTPSNEGIGTSGAATSCQICGAQVPANVVACPICGTETASQGTGPGPTTVLCVYCGATAVQGQDECETCGARLQARGEPLSAGLGLPTQLETSLEDDLDQYLDDFIARIREKEAAAPRTPAGENRTIRTPARVPVTRAGLTEDLRQWGVDRIRMLAFFATIGSLMPAMYVSQSPSEVGRWAIVAVMGSLFATALALTFLETQHLRTGLVRFTAILAGGALLLSVPIRSALDPSFPPIADVASLAAGLGLIALGSYRIRNPPATYLPWLAALPAAFALAVVGTAQAVARPSATLNATWITIGLAMGLTGILELRRRWVDYRVAGALQRAQEGVAKQDFQGSLADLDRAVQISAHGADVPRTAKGATLVLLGRYGEAIKSIDAALRINPKNEVAWVNKGNALARMGRHVDALQCYNSAIRVRPGYEVAWNNKGNALARLGRLRDALNCYDRALEIDPDYRSAWWNRGYVYTRLGDDENAVRCADAVLRLDRRVPAAVP